VVRLAAVSNDSPSPTGAELDRIVGTNNYGRKALRRWRHTGHLPTANVRHRCPSRQERLMPRPRALRCESDPRAPRRGGARRSPNCPRPGLEGRRSHESGTRSWWLLGADVPSTQTAHSSR
jgi:hypothetical protein